MGWSGEGREVCDCLFTADPNPAARGKQRQTLCLVRVFESFDMKPSYPLRSITTPPPPPPNHRPHRISSALTIINNIGDSPSSLQTAGRPELFLAVLHVVLQHRSSTTRPVYTVHTSYTDTTMFTSQELTSIFYLSPLLLQIMI